jgi:hypothetical protein
MMKAGKYYIGDLCYVMHDQWDEFCDITIDDRVCKEGEFRLKNGTNFATYGTQYGDGTFYDQNKYEYGVDAGLLGCIRVEDIDDPEGIERMEELGHVYTFDRPFRTGRTSDGTIYFGHVRIPTGE